MAKKNQSAEEAPMLVAKESFAYRFNGEDHQFSAGQTRVRAGHPILEGIEHLFEPIKAHYEVEQATAAPGEKRGE
jgi:hypothetical protein